MYKVFDFNFEAFKKCATVKTGFIAISLKIELFCFSIFIRREKNYDICEKKASWKDTLEVEIFFWKFWLFFCPALIQIMQSSFFPSKKAHFFIKSDSFSELAQSYERQKIGFLILRPNIHYIGTLYMLLRVLVTVLNWKKQLWLICLSSYSSWKFIKFSIALWSLLTLSVVDSSVVVLNGP